MPLGFRRRVMRPTLCRPERSVSLHAQTHTPARRNDEKREEMTVVRMYKGHEMSVPARKSLLLLAVSLIVAAIAGRVAAAPTDGPDWVRVAEDDRAIKIDTDKLEAVIPKSKPKQWMTGIEKGSFLDKATGFRE